MINEGIVYNAMRKAGASGSPTGVSLASVKKINPVFFRFGLYTLGAAYALSNIYGCSTNSAETKEKAYSANEKRKIDVQKLQKESDEKTSQWRRELTAKLDSIRAKEDSVYAKKRDELNREIDAELKKGTLPGNDDDASLDKIKQLVEQLKALKLDKESKKEINGMYNALGSNYHSQ